MTTYKGRLLAPPDDVNAVHDFLQGIWIENPQVTLRDQHSFETAIIELTGNIILHSDGTPAVNCEISIEMSSDQIDATVSDNGELVEMDIGKHLMPEELSESGRGIPLIKALLDEFSFESSENKNTWRLVKKLKNAK